MFQNISRLVGIAEINVIVVQICFFEVRYSYVDFYIRMYVCENIFYSTIYFYLDSLESSILAVKML